MRCRCITNRIPHYRGHVSTCFALPEPAPVFSLLSQPFHPSQRPVFGAVQPEVIDAPVVAGPAGGGFPEAVFAAHPAEQLQLGVDQAEVADGGGV